MFEDRRLLNKLKTGNSDALAQIYEKYKNDLRALAISLLDDKTQADDVLHDVYLAFARNAQTLHLKSSLKGYLLTSIANRVRNIARSQDRIQIGLETERIDSLCDCPAQQEMLSEEFKKVESALALLPFDQREVITLHFQAGLKFKDIAKAQGVSINTILSRYRYAITKLRSMLNSEAKK